MPRSTSALTTRAKRRRADEDAREALKDAAYRIDLQLAAIGVNTKDATLVELRATLDKYIMDNRTSPDEHKLTELYWTIKTPVAAMQIQNIIEIYRDTADQLYCDVMGSNMGCVHMSTLHDQIAKLSIEADKRRQIRDNAIETHAALGRFFMKSNEIVSKDAWCDQADMRRLHAEQAALVAKFTMHVNNLKATVAEAPLTADTKSRYKPVITSPKK